MLRNVLPAEIWAVIETKLRYERLSEIRLRAGMPVVAGYGGRFLFLTPTGVSEGAGGAFVCDRRAVEGVVQRACEYSLYAYADQLRQGYITVAGGVRIGVAGQVVSENGRPLTLKNISSLNIRIPHEIAGANAALTERLLRPRPLSALIVSPPGGGKTTLLRELARSVSPAAGGKIYSTLVVDERGEIAAVHNCVPALSVGDFTDVITGGAKEYAFAAALRALRPDIILTDEIGSAGDAAAIGDAVRSGAVVFATAHGRNIAEAARRPSIGALIEDKIFGRFITLSDRSGPGTVEEISEGIP